jgi:D-alanine-D-alanine ligase-like ATP-grasp enzyme
MSIGVILDGNKKMGDEILTDKIVDEETRYKFYPFCKDNPELGQKLRKIATNTFKKLNLSGTVRVDFRVTEEGKAYIIDYNNSPHLTEFHSCALSVVECKITYGGF